MEDVMTTQSGKQNSKGPQTELDKVFSKSQKEMRGFISSLMEKEAADQSVAEGVGTISTPVTLVSATPFQQAQVAFASILLFSDAAMVEILKHLDWDLLAFALKGTNNMVQDRFFLNMDARAAALVREFMTCLGPVTQTEVMRAQGQILATIRNLQRKAAGFS